jgi:hypothetical protein
VCTHRILFFFSVSLAVLMASMLFTIHSAECENITCLYINVSDGLKENLYTCSVNEQVFMVRQKTKL